MKRRSIIITFFCLGEIAFALQLILQAEQVKSVVQKWNSRIERRAKVEIESRLKCSSTNDTTCCNSKTLKAMKVIYDQLKKEKRNSEKLQQILYPLIGIAGSNALGVVMFNSGSLEFGKLFVLMHCCSSMKWVRRTAFVFWSTCWMVEIGVSTFVAGRTADALSHLIRKKFLGHKFCKSSGQKIEKSLENIAKCFRKLRVCPTMEEQTLLASIFLPGFILFCAVFKIGYRFFLRSDDSERFKCANCCRCSSKGDTGSELYIPRIEHHESEHAAGGRESEESVKADHVGGSPDQYFPKKSLEHEAHPPAIPKGILHEDMKSKQHSRKGSHHSHHKTKLYPEESPKRKGKAQPYDLPHQKANHEELLSPKTSPRTSTSKGSANSLTKRKGSRTSSGKKQKRKGHKHISNKIGASPVESEEM